MRLQNETLQVDVLPENGGRVASIRCLRTGTEFLLDGSRYGAVAAFSAGAPFEDSDCAGWDECLPTVSLSSSRSGELDAADHGDLWRRPWTILEQGPHSVSLTADCFSHPLTLTRRMHLEAAHLHCDYTLVNRSSTAQPFLYACHPLFAVDPGDDVLLPKDVQDVHLHFSRGNRVGVSGERLSWPLLRRGPEEIALQRAGSATDGSAEMMYVTSLQSGICALYRAQRQQAVVIRFSLESLPCLGLWICNGGWPEQHGHRKQYAIALEPTVAPFGSLAEAVAAHAAPLLQPGAEFRFSIDVEILGCDRPCTYDDVAVLFDPCS